MKFPDALTRLKRGGRVARLGWKGEYLYLYLIPGERWRFTREENAPPLPLVALRTVDRQLVPWVCSQKDLLADDWEVVSG